MGSIATSNKFGYSLQCLTRVFVLFLFVHQILNQVQARRVYPSAMMQIRKKLVITSIFASFC